MWTTLAGAIEGSEDGPASEARFSLGASGLAVDLVGNLSVAERWNNLIRMVTPDGVVSTLVGSGWGQTGYVDGPATTAMLNHPAACAVDRWGNIYIADQGNQRIRKVTPDRIVSTVAGSGTAGFADSRGTAAKFSHPTAVAVDSLGILYVVDPFNNLIRTVAQQDGTVRTLAGTGDRGHMDGAGSASLFASPSAIALDGAGNVYVADAGNNRIRRISPQGIVTTFTGSGAVLSQGEVDGPGSVVRFNSPAVLTEAATIDASTGPLRQARQLGTTGAGATSWSWRVVRRPVGSKAALSSTNVRTPTFTPDVDGAYLFRLTASSGTAQSVTEVRFGSRRRSSWRTSTAS